MDRVEALAPYLEAGLDLIPINKWNAKAPDGREMGKAPVGRQWQLREHSPDDWRDWLARDLNIGYRIPADAVVIDYDPRNDPEAGGLRNSLILLADALDLEGDFCDWPCVRTGGGGYHVYMQLPEEMRVVGELSDFPGVEFKGGGRQVLVAGSRHPNGNWYAWDDFSEPLAAPAWTPPPCHMAPEALVALIRRQAAPEGPVAPGKLVGADVERLLRYLDAENFREYDAWLQLGMACWHACNGDPAGRDAFVAWSATDPQYAGHEGAVRERWATLAPDGEGAITYRTLFQAVLDAGGRLDGVDEFPDLPPLAEGEECRNDPDAPEQAADGGPRAALNRVFCVVPIGDAVRVLSMHDGAWRRQPFRAFEDMLRGQWTEGAPRADGEPRPVPLSSAWLDWAGKRQYRGAEFRPGRETPDEILNLWTGWAVEPGPGEWGRLRQLIYEVLADGDVDAGDYILDWCAWLYQRPWVLPEVAIVLRGGKGAGKGTFGRAITALAGYHSAHFSDSKQLAGQFNGHLESVLVAFADEAFWAGNRSQEAQLKQLVTEPEALWHHKGLTPYRGKNFTHLIMASNADWVVPVSMDERRFCVLDVVEGRIRDHRFFKALNRELYEEGGIRAFAAHLAGRELGVHPRENVPQTRALVEQKLLSLEPLQEAWYEALERGRLLGAPDEWDAGPLAIERDTLVRELSARAEKLGGRFDSPRAVSTKIGIMLKRLCPSARTEKSGQDRRYLLPTLTSARAEFERALGRPLNWTE